VGDPRHDPSEAQLEARKGAHKKDTVPGASEALSHPEQARTAGKNFPGQTAGLEHFPEQHKLLAQIHETTSEERRPSGPTFPLKEAYDPKQGYIIDGKPTAHAQELQHEAKELLAGVAKPDGSLSLKDHAKIMDAIADNKKLTEADKWFLYKEVCDLERQGRNAQGHLIPGTKNYRVLFDAEKPTGIPESLKGDVVRHVIIDPTNDGYHGTLAYGSPGWRSGFMQGEDGIFFHEHIEKPLINKWRSGRFVDRGDEEESHRQLRALRAMQQGGFNAYAESWRHSFAE
jgi:hypothetical protein